MIQCPVTARLIVWRHHPCQWLHLILSVNNMLTHPVTARLFICRFSIMLE
ncbi:uncharacterized protein DS421_13g417770 [Arachis hypogaea]|nr:uncharacterized protein DS421_13g417770 [Arachis hypogaea]